MQFNEVIGQKTIAAQLQRLCREGRIPHAMLLTGVAGCGKLPLALATAQQLLAGVAPGETLSNSAQSADLADRYIHPDLHFVFPVKRKKTGATVSDMYLSEWREQLGRDVYFDFADWMYAMDCEREQPLIYEAESAEILKKLSMKSTMGGRKVMIIVWPERMNEVCANKLLKLIEEPPTQTHIIMLSEEPTALLPTITSRTQTVRVPPIDDFDVAVMLAQRYGLEEEQARATAHLARGSVTAAVKLMQNDGDEVAYLELFMTLMRKAYVRDIKALQQWAMKMADMSRERQKAFVQYAGRLVRENFMFNFRQSRLNYLTRQEHEFATKFARFVNERNVIQLMNELDSAERDIVQNVNSKMVFFDFAMQVIVLLIRK